MDIPGRYWGIGVSAAVLAHAAISVALFWQPGESGARSAGKGGIEISLGPGAGSPGSFARPVAEAAETEPVAPEEVTEPSRAEQSEAPQPETVTARAATTAIEEPAVPVEKVETREAQQKKAHPPEDPGKPAPKTAATQSAEPAATPPPQSTPEIVTPTEMRVTGTSPAAGAQGKAGSESEKTIGSGTSTAGGGVPGVSADYMATLRAWLEKHKRYPRRARRLRQEGTVVLYFVMNREGKVLEYRIRESSGHEALDEEVAAMIERAQPLPRMPDSMERGRLELVVPVQFFLL